MVGLVNVSPVQYLQKASIEKLKKKTAVYRERRTLSFVDSYVCMYMYLNSYINVALHAYARVCVCVCGNRTSSILCRVARNGIVHIDRTCERTHGADNSINV